MEIDKNDIIYLKLGGTLAFHPLELSKVLIQLGHEPIAPRNTKTLLGKPALAYPSVFQVLNIEVVSNWISFNQLCSTVATSEGEMGSLVCGEESVPGSSMLQSNILQRRNSMR